MKTWKTSNIHQQRKFKQIILQTNNGILDCFLKELGKSELIKNDNQDSELNEKSKSQNNYVKYNSTFILKRTNLYISKMSRNVYTRKMFYSKSTGRGMENEEGDRLSSVDCSVRFFFSSYQACIIFII